MNHIFSNVKKRRELFPAIFFFVWAVAQLSVFWLDWFRILVFANIALFSASIIYGGFKGKFYKLNFSTYFLFLLVYIWIIISTMWSPVPGDAFDQAGKVIVSTIPAFAAAEILARRYSLSSILKGLYAFPIIFSFQIAYNIIYYGDPSIVDIYSIRSVAGNIFAVLCPVFFGLFLYKKNRIAMLFASISLFLIILLQSRTGILASIFGIFILSVIYNWRNTVKFSLFASPIIFALMLLPDYYSVSRFGSADTSFDVSANVLGDLAVDRSLRVDFDRRLHTFVAIEMFETSPFFGGGYYSIYLNNKYEFNVDVGAHGFIGSIAEIGLIGFSIFLLYLFKLYKIYASRLFIDYDDRILIVAFLVMMLVGFFHQVFESVFFATLAGLISGRSGSRRFLDRTHSDSS
jgi:hypothetical protein